MNGPLRKVSIFISLLMAALLVNITWLAVARSEDMLKDPRNVRVRDAEFNTNRGAILVGNDAIAMSTPASGTLPWQRTFPQGETYSSVTGWYSYSYGKQELERNWNAELTGTASSQTFTRLVDLLAGKKPQGANLNTTLNPKAQAAAVKALGKQQGAAIAVDYTTGEILALVSTPTYDPNLLASHDTSVERQNWDMLVNDSAEPLKNRAVREIFPPGSTFKLVTAAAALEAGYNPSSTVASPTSYQAPGSSHGIGNSTDCGGTETTLEHALAMSCNTAFAKLGVDLGQTKMLDTAQRFGFNSAPGIDLPSSTSKFPTQMDPAYLAQSSIGQYEVAATPLQMLMVASAIANNGVLMKPHVVKSVTGSDLKVIQTIQPEQAGRPISEGTAKQLKQMMENVVSDGTGSPAQVRGLTIGGKTGTAQSDPNRPPYAWFVGYAAEPHVAVVAFVQSTSVERNDISGGKVAAPVFKAVVESLR